MAQFVRIDYRDKRVTTIKDLLDQQKITSITAKDFLEVKNPTTGFKNRDELFLAYTAQQKKELGIKSSADISESTKIYPPAMLWVQTDKVQIDVIKYDSQFVKPEYSQSFISDQISKIINSSGYYKDEFTKIYPKCSVWVWVKTLEPNSKNPGKSDSYNMNVLNGRIINVSPFIQDVNIGVTDSGGNFSITLPFIPGTTLPLSDEDTGGYSKPAAYYNQHKLDVNEIMFLENGEVVVDTTIFKYGERRTNFLNMIMQSNDLVFIKFEKLAAEPENIIDELFVSERNLPNQYFDMIGLIDSVVQPTRPEDIGVNIQGRDMMKLLLDDGSFFFPNSYVSKDFEKNILINSTGQSDGSNAQNILSERSNPEGRIVSDGMIQEFFQAGSRTINSALSTLIRTLSNIEVAPSSLFDFYGDKRSTFNVNKRVNKKN